MTVDGLGGHVYQSRAWAEHRAASGWTPRFLVAGDGGRALALTRDWRLVGGGSAYLPRGPVAWARMRRRTAARLSAIGDALARDGIDVVAADPEVPAPETAFRAAIEAAGFRADRGDPAVAPSRHAAARTRRRRDAVFAGIAKSTRQRIRGAEAPSVAVVRHDARTGPDGVGEGSCADRGRRTPPSTASTTCSSTPASGAISRSARGRLRRVVESRARRRATSSISRRVPAGRPARRSPGSSSTGTAAGSRRSTPPTMRQPRTSHPGALHLLRWRAIQLAIREGCAEMDLGGVDVAGARGEPPRGRPAVRPVRAQARRSAAAWLELTGAHERVFARALRARAALAGRARAGRSAMTRRRPSPSCLAAAEPARARRRSAALIERLAADGPAARRATRRPGDRPGAASPPSPVRGVTHDSRAVRPGSLFVAVPGPMPTATTSWPRRPRPAPPRRSSSAPLPDVALPQLVVGRQPGGARRRPRPGGTAIRAASWRSSGSPARTARRRRRSSRSAALEAAGHPDRADRHGRDAGSAGSTSRTRSTPRRPRRPRSRRALRAMVAAGDRAAVVETTSHGLALDRVGGIALRRRHPHQPDPRAPRAPRHVRGVPGRQAVAVRAARRGPADPAKPGASAGRGPGSSTPTIRRPARSSASPRRPGARVLTYGTRPGGRRPRHRSSEDARRPPRRLRRRPSGARDARAPARRAGSTSTTRWRSSPSARPRPRPGGGPRRASRRSRASPAGWSASTLGQPFGVIVDYAHSPASLADRARPARPGRGGAGRRARSPSSGRPASATRPSGR